ncbi:MAG: hypothetical protein ACYDC1_13485 [Limisphaerales bacterium]
MKTPTLTLILALCGGTLAAVGQTPLEVASAIVSDVPVKASSVARLKQALAGAERAALAATLGSERTEYVEAFAKCVGEEGVRTKQMVDTMRARYAQQRGVSLSLSAKETDWFNELLPYYNARRRMLWQGLETPAQQTKAGRAVVEARVKLIREPMENHFRSLFSGLEIEAMAGKGLCRSPAQTSQRPKYPASTQRVAANSSPVAAPTGK